MAPFVVLAPRCENPEKIPPIHLFHHSVPGLTDNLDNERIAVIGPGTSASARRVVREALAGGRL